MSLSLRLPPRRLTFVIVMILLVGGCGPPETSGPGPGGGDVGPQATVGPVGPEEGIAGSGNITTETPELESFDRLVFASEGSVVLTQSDRSGLSVTADDNLHQYVEAAVDDSTLTISTVDGLDLAPSSEMVFQVEVSDLLSVELSGVGAITVEGLDGSVLSVVLSGTGDLIIEDLRAERVIVDLEGIGTIRLAGEVDAQEASVSGVGEYQANELVSRVAAVEASGMGKATVWAADELSCVVSESGLVEFYGTPTIHQEVSDSGSVVALGGK